MEGQPSKWKVAVALVFVVAGGGGVAAVVVENFNKTGGIPW